LLHKIGRVVLLSVVIVIALYLKVRVSTEKLTWSWNRPGSVLGPANFKVVAVDLDLLKNKSLSGIISGPKVRKCVMAITRNPTAKNGWSILENTSFFTHLLERRIKELHKLILIETRWNVANVELSFRLVVI